MAGVVNVTQHLKTESLPERSICGPILNHRDRKQKKSLSVNILELYPELMNAAVPELPETVTEIEKNKPFVFETENWE